MVESQPSKLLVAGSSPVSRSRKLAYTVYILKSTKAERYYIGSTENLEKRVILHNSSKARWIKRFQPWVIVHKEDFESRGKAIARERFFKSLNGIANHLEDIKRSKGDDF